MNKRRRLLIALAAGAITPFAFAQQERKVWRIGLLNTATRQAQGQSLAAMIDALAALGWHEGRNFTLEERWADGNYARLPSLAAEIAAKSPAVIVVAPSRAVAAMAKAAPDIPIVVASGDPLAAGLVTNLAHPGGMITGLTNVITQVSEKFLELLLDAVPSLRRVGFLVDPNNPNHALMIDSARRAAAKHSVQGSFAEAGNAESIERALLRLAKDGAQGLIVGTGPLFSSHTKRIVKFAADRRWPSIGGVTHFAEDGGMLAYGADAAARWRRVAWYIDQILKGKKPGDLPIEQPTKFDMLVNIRTAQALGIKLPNSILVQATRVIE